jgi:hypothetical protein
MKPQKEEADGGQPGDLAKHTELAPLDNPTDESTQPFSWDNPDDPSIVIPRQPAIAVYVNQRDEMVIRQEAGIGWDEDEYIFVGIDNVEKLIEGIRARAFPKPTTSKLKVIKGGAGE